MLKGPTSADSEASRPDGDLRRLVEETGDVDANNSFGEKVGYLTSTCTADCTKMTTRCVFRPRRRTAEVSLLPRPVGQVAEYSGCVENVAFMQV